MYVGYMDLDRVAIFLGGCDFALGMLRPDLKDTGFSGFREWLAVRLDSCLRTGWSSIITYEDTGPDKVAAFERLYDEFCQDRRERGLEAIHADYERLVAASLAGKRKRTCWCELPPEERDQWRPGYRRSRRRKPKRADN
jgi:hypothetical protein